MVGKYVEGGRPDTCLVSSVQWGYDADVRKEGRRSMSIRQQNREGWRVPLSGYREQEFSSGTFFMDGLPQSNGRQRIFNEPCSAFGHVVFMAFFSSVSRPTGLLPAAISMRQPPYSKRCTQAKRLSTTKGQQKEEAVRRTYIYAVSAPCCPSSRP